MSRGFKLLAFYAGIAAVIAVGVYANPANGAGPSAGPVWVGEKSVEDRAESVYRGFVAATTEEELRALVQQAQDSEPAMRETLMQGLRFLAEYYVASQGQYPDLTAFRKAARLTYTQLRGRQKTA